MDKDSQHVGPIHRFPRLPWAIGACAVVLLVAAASDPAIAAAKTVAVREAVHLHFVNNRAGVVNEKGTGSGTFNCPIVAQLKFTSTQTSFSFTLTCTSKDTISGHGLVSYYASGKTAHLTGSVAVTHGTGRYAHASSSELLATGTFQRETFAVSMSISGHMRT
jgi:hypothetical protein